MVAPAGLLLQRREVLARDVVVGDEGDAAHLAEVGRRCRCWGIRGPGGPPCAWRAPPTGPPSRCRCR
jgi:hypothetical protein